MNPARITACFALAACSGVSAPTAAANNSRLTLNLIGCAGVGDVSLVRLAVTDLVTGAAVSEISKPLSNASIAYELSVGVPAGSYDVGIYRGGCGADQSIVVLAGKNRVPK